MGTRVPLDPSPVDPPARSHWFSVLRLAAAIVLFTAVIVATYRNWDDVRSALSKIGSIQLIVAEAMVLTGLVVSVATWRTALTEVGGHLSLVGAARIYLVGQLGKYVPGSLWAIAVQADLAGRAGLSRFSAVSASLVAIAVNTVVGLLIGAALVPTLIGDSWHLAGLIVVGCLGTIAISPPVLTRGVDRGLRLVKRPPLGRPTTWGGVLRASGWSVGSAVCYGSSVWVLAVAIGAPGLEALPLCLAGTALAMTLGLLVIVAPSGIGVREAIIVAALAPVLDRADALAVALVARLLFTLADLLAALCVMTLRIESQANVG